jgi:hypothetical protein
VGRLRGQGIDRRDRAGHPQRDHKAADGVASPPARGIGFPQQPRDGCCGPFYRM